MGHLEKLIFLCRARWRSDFWSKLTVSSRHLYNIPSHWISERTSFTGMIHLLKLRFWSCSKVTWSATKWTGSSWGAAWSDWSDACSDHKFTPAEGTCTTFWPLRRDLLPENISKSDTQNFQECLFLHTLVLMQLTSNQPPKCWVLQF